MSPCPILRDPRLLWRRTACNFWHRKVLPVTTGCASCSAECIGGSFSSMEAGRWCRGGPCLLSADPEVLLDRGHSLDTIVGVHGELLMHLCKHDSFNAAGDTAGQVAVPVHLCRFASTQLFSHAAQLLGLQRTWHMGKWAVGRSTSTQGWLLCL